MTDTVTILEGSYTYIARA